MLVRGASFLEAVNLCLECIFALQEPVIAEGAEGEEEEEEEEEDPNSWYRWRQHNIPCFIRPPRSGSAGEAGLPSQGTRARSSGSAPIQQLHLNVVTCAVNPDLMMRTDLKWVGGNAS